jgi:hypothetical protein
MIRKLKDGVEWVKAMIIALFKVGNAIKDCKANNKSVIPELIDVARIYFVGIFL